MGRFNYENILTTKISRFTVIDQVIKVIYLSDRTAYGLFLKKKWGELNEGASATERLKELSKVWSGMTVEERKVMTSFA